MMVSEVPTIENSTTVWFAGTAKSTMRGNVRSR